MLTRVPLALLIAFPLMLGTVPQGFAASVQAPWPQRKAVPSLSLLDLDGKAWRQADLKGRVTLLNFWATWCEPCRDELPAMARLHASHADRLQVLTVNYQEGPEKVRRFLQAGQIALPVLLDRDGSTTRSWTSRIFPTTVVLDVTGRPRFSVTGEFDWGSEEAARLLAPLLR